MSIDGYKPEYRNDPEVMNIERRKILFSFSKYIEDYFDYEVHGLEHIPAKGRAIITPYHGLLPVDVQLLFYEIYKKYGRIVRFLTDHRVFAIPFFRTFFLDLGALDGTHRNGEILLREREDLIVISPGGAREGWRSSFQKNTLTWQGRYGFIKLALRTRTPIIPAVCLGIDNLYFNPVNGMELAERLIGKSFPVPLCPPIGLGLLPFRAKLTQLIDEPILFDLPPSAADDPETVMKLQSLVADRMNKMLARNKDHGSPLSSKMGSRILSLCKYSATRTALP